MFPFVLLLFGVSFSILQLYVNFFFNKIFLCTLQRIHITFAFTTRIVYSLSTFIVVGVIVKAILVLEVVILMNHTADTHLDILPVFKHCHPF